MLPKEGNNVMQKEIYLTGITTTGTPHIGNYVGAIRPGVQASKDKSKDNFYFLAGNIRENNRTKSVIFRSSDLTTWQEVHSVDNNNYNDGDDD